ncbi:hypothetical protein GGS26DRAFT_597296 [Hypomontagnella submonticulosa]|nr:hypothetical protein GGS26DRAFT_597296 [Hypomontagnella submonticulosa]
MHFTSALLAALAATSCSAVVLPEGTPNGVYVWPAPNSAKLKGRQEKSGEWTKIGDITPRDATSENPNLSRRWSWPSGAQASSECNPQPVKLSTWDYDEALETMKSNCVGENSLIPRGGNYAVVYGSALIYGCSWGGSQPCRREEVERFSTDIDLKCGDDGSGFIHLPGWRKAYGRDHVGIDICPR